MVALIKNSKIFPGQKWIIKIVDYIANTTLIVFTLRNQSK